MSEPINDQLEVMINGSIGELQSNATLNEIRDAVLYLSDLAYGEDPLSRELLRQTAIRELKERFNLPSPEKLLETAFNYEES